MVSFNHGFKKITDLSSSKSPEWLTECSSADAVAFFFDLNYEDLAKLIYPTTLKSYRSFLIPKKSGKNRTIDAPKKKLREIQKKLADELSKIYKPKASSHGFIKKRSIITNAEKHVRKKFVFNIDLLDFFGSIHFGRVRNLFMAFPLYLPHDVATVLAQICCNKGKLPQGAPTSPIISNMICFKLDNELQNLAKNERCCFSRYADDISFSFTSSKKKLPKSIVKLDKNGNAFEGEMLKKIIESNGFKINQDKVRLLDRDKCQSVTGLTVNEKINVKRSFVRQTFSMLYAWEKFGKEKAEVDYISKYRQKSLRKRQLLKINKTDKQGDFFIDVVKGRINYLKMIRGANDPIYKKLRYKLSDIYGEPNLNYRKSKLDFAADAVFVLENGPPDHLQGTAFLLEDIGMVTSYHIVPSINIDTGFFCDFFRFNETDKKRKCDFLESNMEYDFAIFDPKENFNDIVPLKIGDDSKIVEGTQISLLGFPGYNEGDSLHKNSGKVIQTTKKLGLNLWMIDIPIVHGISGGPVLNDNYEVIGISTLGSERNDASTTFFGFTPISNLLKNRK